MFSSYFTKTWDCLELDIFTKRNSTDSLRSIFLHAQRVCPKRNIWRCSD